MPWFFFDNITGLVDKDNAVDIIYLYFPNGFDLVTYDTQIKKEKTKTKYTI